MLNIKLMIIAVVILKYLVIDGSSKMLILDTLREYVDRFNKEVPGPLRRENVPGPLGREWLS